MSTARTRLGRRLSAAAISLLVCGVIAEFALRSLAPVAYRAPIDRARDADWGELLHVASATPGLAYELAPDRSIKRWKLLVRTNHLGMRDDPPLASPPDDLVRIVSLGDSVAFGYGVREEDAYPALLEGLLAEVPGAPPVEVLNFAVSGYTTADEVTVFERKALAYRPRAVVVGYHLNDPEPLPLQPLQQQFEVVRWWQHSHVLRGIAALARDLAIRRLGGGDYYRYLHAEQGRPWREARRQFARLRALGDRPTAAELPIVLVIFPLFEEYEHWDEYAYDDEHARIASAARENGFHVLDALEIFRRAGVPCAELRRDRGHPNAAGHRLVALALRDLLSGLLFRE